MRALSIFALLLALAAPCEAQVLVVVENGAPEARSRAWRERVEHALGARLTTLSAWAAASEPVDTVEPERLAVLGEIEALIVRARESAVRLEERDALRTLAHAEDLAARHLDVPGMSAWLAEIELAIALTAAQAELGGLADAALLRAASIDPSRAVQAGEARPDLVERSRDAVRALATGPRGRFEVSSTVPGARAYLDDRPLGALPRSVEAGRGRHVLRIEAPGHRTWAEALDVLEGERPPVHVALSPTTMRAIAQRTETAARDGDAREVARGLAALASREPPTIWILWTSPGAEDRALLARCEARGCGTVRLEDSVELEVDRSAELGAEIAWLGAEHGGVGPREEPFWERWYVWVAAGLVAAAAATAIGVAAQPQGPGPLIVDVDPGDVPGGVD